MLSSHRLYVGTIGEGIWRSTDAGETFARASDGLFVECHVRALVVDPRDPRILYAGTEQGLHRSVDGGNSWPRLESPLNGLQVWSVFFHHADPDILFAGTCPSRLFRSGDGGSTWIACAAVLEQQCPRILHTRVTCFATAPDDPDTVWTGVEIDGIQRSRDGGLTWRRIGTELSSQDIHALVAVPARSGHGQRLLAATNNDLNLSEDDGETWRPLRIDQSLPWSYCRALQQQSGRPEVVLLGNGNGPPGSAGVVGRSDNGGLTWHAAVLPGHANSTIWNFAIHHADPEMIYASSVSGEVYRSRDGGLTWGKLQREFGEIRALAWAP